MFTLRVSNDESAGVHQYYPLSIEAPPLFHKWLDAFPISMIVIVPQEFKCYSAKSGLLVLLSEPPKFTGGCLAYKEIYSADRNQYDEAKCYQETKL
jgi:hypothetical protein